MVKYGVYTEFDCFIGNVVVEICQNADKANSCIVGLNLFEDSVSAYHILKEVFGLIEDYDKESRYGIYVQDNNTVYAVYVENYYDFHKTLFIAGIIVVCRDIFNKNEMVVSEKRSSVLLEEYYRLIMRLMGGSAIVGDRQDMMNYLIDAGKEIHRVPVLFKYNAILDGAEYVVVRVTADANGECLIHFNELSNMPISEVHVPLIEALYNKYELYHKLILGSILFEYKSAVFDVYCRYITSSDNLTDIVNKMLRVFISFIKSVNI